MHAERAVFSTDDGYEIVGRVFSPGTEIRGAVVIASAMGVTQEFYAPLASWLAGNGYLVTTFDYRGVGQSLRGDLRGFKADIFDWATHDSSAALKQARRRAGETPIYWLGHSLGGQIVPFVRDIASVTKIITVASGSGYWRENAKPLRYYARWLWFFVVPLVLPLCGYFPGKRLRIVGDLPSGVMWQWRRWCLHPRYSVGAEGLDVEADYAAISAPIISLAFEDDEMMSKQSIATLHGFFTNADVTLKQLGPSDVGVSHVGHFGFFRPAIGQPLWDRHLLVELSPSGGDR